VGAAPARVLNLTGGALPDETVRKWIVADARRGTGDAWAADHMRLDIVNAGVLGPPGLNGTELSIARDQAAGIVEVRCPPQPTLAAGVILVQKDTQREIPWAGLTDFVIVQVFQSTGEPCTHILSNGTSEIRPPRRKRGELRWQLDTGEFHDDPVVGPLWYQARGWTCAMDGRGMLDGICGLVQPNPTTLTMLPDTD
jgi:hypothetical protein